MSTCTATQNLSGITLRCDRTAGHERRGSGTNPDHYDFHQDAFWSVIDLEDGGIEIQCDFRRVGGSQ